VSLYAYINPIIAVVLGTLVLSEPFNVRMLLAAAVVFAGIVLVRSTGKSAIRTQISGAQSKSGAI
jgi:drug/metabolite transporter (DMT)-like permease